MNLPLKIISGVVTLLIAGLATAMIAQTWKKNEVFRTVTTHIVNDFRVGSHQQNLLIGSSSIARLNASRYLLCGPWLNRGIGNARLSDLSKYIEHTFLQLAPRHILVYAGENDISAGLQPSEALHDYLELLESLSQKFPGSTLHVLAIKPSPKRQQYNEAFHWLNLRLQRLALQSENLNFHNVAWPSTDVDPVFESDGIHLTDYGYRLLTSGVNNSCS